MSFKEKWLAGYGVVSHTTKTKEKLEFRVSKLLKSKRFASEEEVYKFFHHIDLINNYALWLVAHTSYSNRVYFDGRTLQQGDLKKNPEGHMGGSLNIVPAYLGYIAANFINDKTAAWMMGQGHCVIAIDVLNVLTRNLSHTQKSRYSFSEEGLSQLCKDFYSYLVSSDGSPEAPLGSHVNAHTGGGTIEGGYLGFAELLYGHAALKGETLIAILSDGSFEEQRGSDWFPRWWRAEDCGVTVPIMIANGRRIDQRTTMQQQGGVNWFCTHLQNHSFEPILIDGKDPAAFVLAILEAEEIQDEIIKKGVEKYPVKMPYIIAETIKGYGFAGAGSNSAHNLPLGVNPSSDSNGLKVLNESLKSLWVDHNVITEIINKNFPEKYENRPKEKDHALAKRDIKLQVVPEISWEKIGEKVSPMAKLDEYFLNILKSNPSLRVRLGNPDELRSNKMNATLDYLKHRVTAPESGIAESTVGSVITALNEEAVICAALGNKGGINMAVTYEAFAVKMLGAIRQEIIFASNLKHIGQEPKWLSVPVITTSHTWENGKNEHSHQDTTFCEALMNENSYQSRVLFPADANSAVAALRMLYQTQAKIYNLVIAKNSVNNFCTPESAKDLFYKGAIIVEDTIQPKFIITAIGSYQLEEARIAFDILKQRGVAGRLIYMQEPAKFRNPRSHGENEIVLKDSEIEGLYPSTILARVFITHTRPEALMGVLRKIDTGYKKSIFLGYINRGGTLSTRGLLFYNQSSALHIVKRIADVLELALPTLLSHEQIKLLDGNADLNKYLGLTH